MSNELEYLGWSDFFAKQEPEKPKKKNKNLEDKAHQETCSYLSTYYPQVIYTTDLSGIRLQSKKQRSKIKALRSSNGIPDLHILAKSEHYGALFIEMKEPNGKILKKNGEYFSGEKGEHIKEQYNILKRLREQGFFGTFCIGFEDAKKLIDDYFANKILVCKYEQIRINLGLE